MPLLAVLLYAVAGLCLFLLLLNRVLILWPDSRLKAPVILLACALLTGGPAWFGAAYARPSWILVPLSFLGLIAVGEVHRAVLRSRAAGSRPVETTPRPLHRTRPVTTTDLVCRRYEMSSPKWTGPVLRVAHLTDLHVNPKLPFEFYEQAFRTVEEHRPDLVFLTGDFLSEEASLSLLAQLLRPLGTCGTFATLGNHDYWVNPDRVRAAILASGITLLANESMTVRLNGGSLRISGFDYPWSGSAKTLPPSLPDELHLVLSHTPDNIYRLSRAGADGVFSGHYHAGQLRAPFLGPIVVPSVYGRRFDHGHFVVKGTHLFVSSGLGAAAPAFRLYCPPDVFLVDIGGEGRPAPIPRAPLP